MTAGAGPQRLNGAQIIQTCITRDARVPLFDDDCEMEFSWRCIPVAPDDDPAWFIIDDSSDRKTVWPRWRREEAA